MVKRGAVDGRRSKAARFERFVRPHYDMLYRTAYYWTRSAEDAEDLVQELCVRAFPRLDELEALDRPASWLTQVMYRMFVDLTRRHERRRVVPLSDAAYASLRADGPGPDEQAERIEQAGHLQQAWRRLDREKRALLALHDVEGYTLAELGEMTGLTESTLKSRLHRTRVLLGRMLERDGGAAGTGTDGGVA